MPNRGTAKTALGPRHKLPLIVIGVVLIVLYGSAALVFAEHKDSNPACSQAYRNDVQVRLGGKEFKAEKSATEASREQGLSGRACIGGDQAMLFAFDKPDRYCFWMKNMNFPIDMVWLDAQKRVTNLVPDAQPSSYPTSFCPNEESQYVLELRAGSLRHLEVTLGDSAKF
jgi:uncharacterized membrane protein (UPF0127 family)